MPEPGLRARKKQATRQALHDAAVRLVQQRGWAATSVADVAAAAGVSTRTFFGYFPTKDDALLAPWAPALDALDAALADRPHGGTALEELRAWLVAHVLDAPPPEELDALLDRLVVEVPSFAAAAERLVRRVERALQAALRDDMASPDADPLPEVAAAATVAVLSRSAAFGGAVLSAAGRRTALDRLDTALAFVEHGLAGVARQRTRDARRSRPPGHERP